jgi:Predicted transcriptional regulator containing CBS domains
MTINDLCGVLELKVLAGGDSLDREVADCYTGDLLSWVMARLPADAAWLTVIGNVNAVAVACLKDAACIILTDSAPLDDDAEKQARQRNMPVLSCALNSYELGAKLYRLLQ